MSEDHGEPGYDIDPETGWLVPNEALRERRAEIDATPLLPDLRDEQQTEGSASPE